MSVWLAIPSIIVIHTDLPRCYLQGRPHVSALQLLPAGITVDMLLSLLLLILTWDMSIVTSWTAGMHGFMNSIGPQILLERIDRYRDDGQMSATDGGKEEWEDVVARSFFTIFTLTDGLGIHACWQALSSRMDEHCLHLQRLQAIEVC